MNLSELIAQYGDDKVQFQRLDDCASAMNMNSNGTKITFVTPERLTPDGTEKLGLVLWLDRSRVSDILSNARAALTAKGGENAEG